MGALSWLVGGVGLAAAAYVGVELAHRRASARAAAAAPGGSLAVIVLGYPSPRRGGVHPVQRWRAAIAARTVAGRPGSFAVFTGGDRAGGAGEAETMAGYARRELGLPDQQIRLETRARTTWENVELSLPLAESADRIGFASDPLHAARARRYLLAQRPDLAGRLARTEDYRPGEHPVLKAGTAAYELAGELRRRAAGTVRPRGTRGAG